MGDGVPTIVITIIAVAIYGYVANKLAARPAIVRHGTAVLASVASSVALGLLSPLFVSEERRIEQEFARMPELALMAERSPRLRAHLVQAVRNTRAGDSGNNFASGRRLFSQVIMPAAINGSAETMEALIEARYRLLKLGAAKYPETCSRLLGSGFSVTDMPGDLRAAYLAYLGALAAAYETGVGAPAKMPQPDHEAKIFADIFSGKAAEFTKVDMELFNLPVTDKKFRESWCYLESKMLANAIALDADQKTAAMRVMLKGSAATSP